ncbi:MAG: hypothetical protein RLZZ342_178, partial [Candidatus Parcubacteria bacterium]
MPKAGEMAPRLRKTIDFATLPWPRKGPIFSTCQTTLSKLSKKPAFISATHAHAAIRPQH